MTNRKTKILSLILLTIIIFLLISIPTVVLIGAYNRIQDEGTDLTQRQTVNFTGSTVSCVDNAGSGRTDCTISGAAGSGYATVKDEAVALTARTTVAFLGATITCVDAAPDTNCTLTESSDYDTIQDDGTPLTQRATVNFVGVAISCADSGGITVCTLTETADTQDYDTVEDEGTPLTQRSNLNFIGSIVTCVDAVPDTTCTFVESSDYDTVQDEGTPLTQRATINFVGSGISCADSGGITVCTLSGGGSGDNISVNGVAATDADFDDNTPAEPAAGTNVHFQKDSSTPNNISAHILPWELTFTSFGYLSGTITTSPATGTINDWSPTGWNDAQPNQATIIRVTALSSTIITGLAGGVNGRLVLILNTNDGSTSASRLIILPHESALSTAANRFSFSDQMPRFLLGGDSIQFVYDAVSQRWREFPNRASWTNVFTDYCEFSGGTAGACVTTFVSGTGAACILSSHLAGDSSDEPIGTAECSTGTTAAGRGYFSFSSVASGQVVPAHGQALLIFRIAIPIASSAGERFQIYAGVNDGANGTSPSDGFYFLYDDAVSGNWRICSEDAGAQVCATTDLAIGGITAYQWLGAYVFGDWSNATFFYSNTGTTWDFMTPNSVPAANGPEQSDTTGFSVGINKTVGTSARTMVIDLFGFRYDIIRGQ